MSIYEHVTFSCWLSPGERYHHSAFDMFNETNLEAYDNKNCKAVLISIDGVKELHEKKEPKFLKFLEVFREQPNEITEFMNNVGDVTYKLFDRINS